MPGRWPRAQTRTLTLSSQDAEHRCLLPCAGGYPLNLNDAMFSASLPTSSSGALKLPKRVGSPSFLQHYVWLSRWGTIYIFFIPIDRLIIGLSGCGASFIPSTIARIGLVMFCARLDARTDHVVFDIFCCPDFQSALPRAAPLFAARLGVCRNSRGRSLLPQPPFHLQGDCHLMERLVSNRVSGGVGLWCRWSWSTSAYACQMLFRCSLLLPSLSGVPCSHFSVSTRPRHHRLPAHQPTMVVLTLGPEFAAPLAVNFACGQLINFHVHVRLVSPRRSPAPPSVSRSALPARRTRSATPYDNAELEPAWLKRLDP